VTVYYISLSTPRSILSIAMFDFTADSASAPTHIVIPTLYHPASASFTAGSDKENTNAWLSQHVIQDENIEPSIANVVDSYGASQTRHRRQRSCTLSIGIGYPTTVGMKSPLQPSRLVRENRPPLSIRIPNLPQLNPIRRRVFNTPQPPSPGSAAPLPACTSMPSLQAVSDWVAASQRRARESRNRGSKLVAARIMALHSPKAVRIRLPPSEEPRPYVRSSLSQCLCSESDS